MSKKPRPPSDQTADAAPDPAPAAAKPYVVLARKYRPSTFADLIGQEPMVRTLTNAFQTAASHRPICSPACAGSARPPRRGSSPGRSTTPSPAPISGPPSRCGISASTARRSSRAGMSTCVEMDAASQHRHRRHPRDHRGGALQACLCALQGLHHRRSAYALQGGLQRPAEDAGRAAAACEVHLRHHRDSQGAGDGALALPALRSAPDRRRGAGRAFRGIVDTEHARPSRKRWH